MNDETFAASALRAAGVACGVLGWSPDAFWNATPAELVTALGWRAGGEGEVLGGRDLAALMERFPDGR